MRDTHADQVVPTILCRPEYDVRPRSARECTRLLQGSRWELGVSLVHGDGAGVAGSEQHASVACNRDRGLSRAARRKKPAASPSNSPLSGV